MYLKNNMFSLRRKKYDQLSDEVLLDKYKSTSDKEIIGVFYKRYGHLVMGVSLKYLKDVALAEDMTMNLFERLFKNLHQYEINHFKSWLFMVTRNDCLMYLRKIKRTIPIELENYLSTEDEFDNSIKNNQELNYVLIEKNIHYLKNEQRDCIELFYLKNCSYTAISEELGISIKQVKSALQNGKRNLKLLLEKEDEFNKEI